MALTVHALLAAIALVLAVISLVPWPYQHHLVAVAAILLAVSALVP